MTRHEIECPACLNGGAVDQLGEGALQLAGLAIHEQSGVGGQRTLVPG